MAYGIHRADKAKQGDLAGLEMEANRTEKDKHSFPKSDIDWERTKYNYNFVKSENWDATIKQIVKDHGITKTIRKDAVMMIDGLYTASPEFFEGKTQEEIKEYFRECLEFHKEHYGIVFNAVVHLDEKTPHMAVASVPLVKNTDGSYSLSAKRLMGGRVDYHDRQDEFFNNVTEKHGLERGEVQNPEARREHLDNLDFKLKMREEEVKAAEADKVDLEAQKDALEEKIGKLETLGGMIKRFSFKLDCVFARIGDLFERGFNRLCSLIERREPIREADVERADCTMHRCGKVTIQDSGTVYPLYYPKTNAGTPVTWDGVRPVAAQDKDGEYLFGWKKGEDGIVACPPEEWGKTFDVDNRDDVQSAFIEEWEDINNDIDAMRRVVEPEEIDQYDLEDPELPEEVDYGDTDYTDADDIIPDSSTDDDSEDSECDDVGID